jgi:hypothetical protein
MRANHETPLTRKYWEHLGEGILYEEFGIVRPGAGIQVRRVDGVVVLGTSPRIASADERRRLSLDGEDVIVIQAKATPLNPYVFGQALLSMDLITMRWTPRSLRSVLICAADNPELRPVIEDFHDLEICIESVSEIQRFGLPRLDGAAAIAASRLGGAMVAPEQLSTRLRIDAVLIPAAGDVHRHPLADLVAGSDVTSVHSHVASGKAPNVGMWISGEVIIAQALLTRMGAASATSVIVGNHDGAVEAALRRLRRIRRHAGGSAPDVRS